MFAVDDFLLFIASLVILILVIFKYKRCDLFLLEIPILFFARGLISIPVNYVTLMDTKLPY